MIEKENDLYYAVVEHVRSWLSDDGIFRAAIDQAGGEINGYQVRQIAKIYNVNRGIAQRNDNDDQAADNLAKLLNTYRGKWSVDFYKRAEQCVDIATKAKSLDCTSKLQVSAITKFSWFVRPENWTVFDRYVAKALKIKEGPAKDRMLEFYQVAYELNFLVHAESISKIISRSQISNLSGPRVLDKLLMLRGAGEEWRRQTISSCESFLSILPGELGNDVKRIAREVQCSVDSTILIRGMRPTSVN